jgi:two-component system, sensor histidine kinase and response regulator
MNVLEATIDLPLLAQLRELQAEGEPDLLVELAALFTADGAERRARLQVACAQGDAATIERQAHALKGGAANFGARRLTRLCGELQLAGQAGDVPRARALLPQVVAELARVEEALRAVLRAGLD